LTVPIGKELVHIECEKWKVSLYVPGLVYVVIGLLGLDCTSNHEPFSTMCLIN